MRRLIVREWKHLSVWYHNGLSGKSAEALRGVHHCAFYQLSFTVWMEAAAELERLWSFYFMWQWARMMSVHEVYSGALLFRRQLTQKQHSKKEKRKSIKCNQIPTGVELLLCSLKVFKRHTRFSAVHVYIMVRCSSFVFTLFIEPSLFILTCLCIILSAHAELFCCLVLRPMQMWFQSLH